MKHKEESTHHETNGLAKDTHKTESARTATTRQEMQGYALGVAGILLLTFAFTGFTWLKWVTVVGSTALILFGAYRANVFERVYHYIQGLKK